MALRVGDKVLVRPDLELIGGADAYDKYGIITNSTMVKKAGTTVTISGIIGESHGTTRYYIEEDMNGYIWTDKMFVTEYKVGDKVRVKKDLRSTSYVEAMSEMKKFEGKIVTIVKADSDNCYKIQGCDRWWFAFEHLEPVDTTETTIKTKTNQEENIMAMFRIKSVKTINEKVVEVKFANGDVQKAVCMPGDTFDPERGLEICIMKHLLGKDKYHKALKDASKQIKNLEAKAEKEKAEAEARAKKKAKDAATKKRRAERKKAARVAEMKTAYLEALKEYNGNLEFSEDALK